LDYECYEDVILYAELAMTIKQKLLGPSKESIIACYEQNRNRHLALAALGRLREAQDWEPDPESCSEDPTYTNYMIKYHFFHANISMICGLWEKAHAILQNVLEMRTKIFGPTGRSTLDTYHLLAMLELKKGNKEVAQTYLRKSLERPGEWTNEVCARAKYRLAQLLLLKNEDDDEAQVLMKEASAVRASCWEAHAKYWPAEVPIPDEDKIYDHIVPAEAGRLAMRPLPAASITPKLNDICRQLQARLGSSEVVLSPRDLVETLRTTFPIPIGDAIIPGPR